ncbi:hypothetical protein NO108_04892 [Planktothrix rubescens]|nr:hypothetical protein NO108_04892 [Planktothrix rubescens]
MINKFTLTGFKAFSKSLEILFSDGEEIWLKIGTNKFYQGFINAGNITELYSTKGEKTDRVRVSRIDSPFDCLRKASETLDGGALFIPAKPNGYPLTECVRQSDLLSCEMDGGTTEEQWERLENFVSLTGLTFAAIIHSGSKSLHGHIKLVTPVGIDTRTQWQRLLSIAMLSDPMVNSPHQPMRIPGYHRLEKGKEQTLESYSKTKHSFDEIWEGFRKIFDVEGYQFYTSFTSERWSKIFKILCNRANLEKGEIKLSPDEQKAEIKRILSLTEDEITPPRKIYSNDNFSYSGDVIPLEFFLPKSLQEILQSGIGAGSEGRNPTAFKLSQVLQGIEETLNRLGVKYSSDSYQLVSNFGARCHPSITIDGAYKNAKKYPLQIDEADINKKISYWEYSNNPDSFADSVRKTNPNPNQQIPNDDWVKQRDIAAKKAWRNNKKYTPHHTFSEPYCISPMAPKQDEIVCLKNHTGQGKTTKIKAWFENELKDYGGAKFGARRGLERQFSGSSKFRFSNDDGEELHIIDPKGCTTGCIDSIGKYRDNDFDDKVLVLDEIESLMRHTLYGGTLKERQQPTINKFAVAQQRCNSIILADGMMSDAICDYIQKKSGKKLIKYYNDVIPTRPDVYFYDDMERNFTIKMAHQIKGEAFPLVAFDNQEDCQSLDKDLTRYGRKVFRVDSKTANDTILGKEVTRFLSNPDLFLKENEITKTYDVILHTPTIESGLDINWIGFSGVYLFATHLEINSILQMLIRVRDINCPRHVCAPKFVKSNDDCVLKSPFKKTFNQLEFELQQQSIEALGPELGLHQDEIMERLIEHIRESYKSPEQDLFNTFNAIKNYEHSNYRECLIESLQQSGYNVIFVQIGKPIMTQFKECKIEVKESVASDISIADKIDENQYKKLSKRQDLKWADRCSVTKYRLLERLPGVEGLGWDKDLVFHLLFENKKLISQAEIRWMLDHPELATKRSKKAWHGVLKFDRTFLGNFKTLLPLIKELNQLNVPALMDKLTQNYYNSEHPEVKSLWESWGRVQVTRTGIERGNSPVMLIKRLAAKLGYETVESGAVWVNGATIKNYILNDLLTTSQYGIIVAGCVAERLESENLDPGIGDSDWLEILHPESLETLHSIASSPYKPTHYTIDINDPVCKASNLNTASNTAITNVENQQPTPEPITELITAPTSTPEPEPDPLSWKGATGRIKNEIAPYWLESYKVYKESNPLTRSGGRVKSVDNSPTWKHNAMAPDKGGWALLVEIEGFGTKINIPIECLEFEGI